MGEEAPQGGQCTSFKVTAQYLRTTEFRGQLPLWYRTASLRRPWPLDNNGSCPRNAHLSVRSWHNDRMIAALRKELKAIGSPSR